MIQPEFPADFLEIDEIIIGKTRVKILHDLSSVRKVLDINPRKDGFVVNLILERQQAVGVDEDRDATEAKCFIESY